LTQKLDSDKFKTTLNKSNFSKEEKTMAKKIWLGMLAIALVLGMTVVSCDDGGGAAKSITITGITGKTGEAMIMVGSSMDEAGMAAMGFGEISGGSVTFDLMNEQFKPFTGSGSYFLYLEFEDGGYVYTNGKTFDELGLNINSSEDEIYAKLPKYNISSENSSIAFNKFIIVPEGFLDL
jgi:hypothetical protein